ncbi:MAG TPA: hypothetical protein VMS37_36360 [Verrucomicrobiae bacterium]|nr:hypothetical protein [Verrucomicrobiae bacterium]
MNRHRSPNRSGVAIVEFTLSLVFLIPLLLGTFIFGFRLIRSLEMEQIVRDLGHMYIRGVNFRNPGPQQNAQTLSSGFDLSSTGSSLVILSTIRILQQADCDAANPLSPPGTPCTNLNNPVFTEQLTVGNASLQVGGNTVRSAFGKPPLQSDFTVTSVNQANNSGAAAGNTGTLSGFAGILVLQAGEFAYVVEMFNATPDLNIPGFSGTPQVYARSVF